MTHLETWEILFVLFFYKQLQERVVKNEPCCAMMEEGNVDGAHDCKNCGKVDGYEVAI